MRKKSVLFVSNTSENKRPFKDASTRYRCFVPASALARRGYRVEVCTQQLFENKTQHYNEFDYYIFHRPVFNEKIGDFLYKMKGSERLIADYDDYIINVEASWQTPAYRFRGADISGVARYIAGNATAARFFQVFTASTSPLGSEIGRLFSAKKVAVIPNALDPGFCGIAQLIRERVRGVKRPYRFGYFAGTATHDQDLSDVAPAIAEALAADANAKMLILGPAKVPDMLMKFGSRIDARQSLVPFHRLPAMMAQVDTVLAPLERNSFTECKSGLKFFEAAAVGCCVVGTPIADIDRFDSPLLRKCSSLEEWTDALMRPFGLSPEKIEEQVGFILQMVSAENVMRHWEQEIVR